ncbi:hypothetical protein CRYUN_Cryun05aG0077100 [Craigia yunnanensis]
MKNPATASTTSVAKATATTTTTTRHNKRGPWTPEEDELLATYIQKEGGGRWRTLPKRAGLLRCGKSCRLRWMNYLRPSVKRGQIAPDERISFFAFTASSAIGPVFTHHQRVVGLGFNISSLQVDLCKSRSIWSLIAGRIPGRTDNEIKNYWNTHLSKKLISQGIDPRTHRPLNPQQSPNHLKASSSSKANHGAATIPNPNINSASSRSQIMDADKENEYFQNHYQTDDAAIAHGFTSLLNCDASGIEMRSSNQNQEIRSNEEDEDINYCTDDVFSSFLNSLINEDAFTNQNQMQQQTNAIAQADALDSITATTFGLGQGWESPIMSSSFNQNDPKRVNDHLS